VCALDLSKALDKMNHHGLFVKLMERHITVNLLMLLERWFTIGMTCVKWYNVWSSCLVLAVVYDREVCNPLTCSQYTVL